MIRDGIEKVPGRDLAAAQARAEFDLGNLTTWVAGLRHQGLGLALPALILKLDTLAKSDLPPTWRVAVLKMLKPSILRAAASLPKPVGGLQSGGGAGLTLEQRLLALMQANLDRAIMDLGRLEFSDAAGVDAARGWATRNLFAFIERQIRYGMDWEVPWPPGTWLGLYDLHLFFTERGHRALPCDFENRQDTDPEDRADFDPTHAFKRLLLLGIASQAKPWVWDDQELYNRLDAWAQETRLDDPGPHVWEFGISLLEIGKDAPPRHHSGILEDSFHGFVVVPPRDYLDCIGRGPARQWPGLRPF